jgi:fatty-acid desaturase
VPGFVTALASRLNNWVTHESRFGTQDNDTGDNSRNVWWWNILLFCSGEGWANNHHYRSGDYDFGRPQRRVDLVARLIEIMAKIGIVKVK